MLGPVYVFGPEASGTKYVARNVATALNGKPVLVDGEPWSGNVPECVQTLATGREVQHGSLLEFGGNRLHDLDVEVVQTWDKCKNGNNPHRVRINATAVLNSRPDAIAVIVVRRALYSNLATFGADQFSIYHDDERWNVRRQSHERDLEYIRTVLAVHFDRTLLVDYEDFSLFFEHTWRRILHFVQANATNINLAEDFYDSNAKWIDLCIGKKTFFEVKDEVFPWLMVLTAAVVAGIMVSVFAWTAVGCCVVKLRSQKTRPKFEDEGDDL